MSVIECNQVIDDAYSAIDYHNTILRVLEYLEEKQTESTVGSAVDDAYQDIIEAIILHVDMQKGTK